MSESMSRKVEIAHDICLYAHAGQVDKAGQPYYLHPENVADHVDSETEKIVALLHDVMEDTEFPASVLEVLFGDEVMTALGLLRHEPGIEYLDYIERLKANAVARAVKEADLGHNMQLKRLPSIEPDDIVRMEKYKKALALLRQADK